MQALDQVLLTSNGKNKKKPCRIETTPLASWKNKPVLTNYKESWSSSKPISETELLEEFLKKTKSYN